MNLFFLDICLKTLGKLDRSADLTECDCVVGTIVHIWGPLLILPRAMLNPKLALARGVHFTCKWILVTITIVV